MKNSEYLNFDKDITQQINFISSREINNINKNLKTDKLYQII